MARDIYVISWDRVLSLHDVHTMTMPGKMFRHVNIQQNKVKFKASMDS